MRDLTGKHLILNAATPVMAKAINVLVTALPVRQQHVLDKLAAANIALFRQFVQSVYRICVDFQLHAVQPTHFILSRCS